MVKINVVGAGLAGSEAINYLVNQGYDVEVFEMRPVQMTPAHISENFAELVCSNSLKSNSLENACGLLKEEMRHMNSITMRVAQATRVPSGEALSVDREAFSSLITNELLNNSHVHIHRENVISIPDGITIIATGPLTSIELMGNLKKIMGEDTMSFFDASAPIISKNTIDFSKAYYKSRYDQGDASYINCPFSKEEYYNFVKELIGAKTSHIHEFDKNYFEGCMPIEVMASRGEDTLRFGPLKPKGLWRSKEDRSYAVVQLRQDNLIGDLYNIVGFQTNLTYGEQKRVFRLIPGLEKVEFVRYGLMHRNSFIKAPLVLKNTLQLQSNPNVFIAGQLSGVEGYVESAATGIFAAINALRLAKGLALETLPLNTMLGSLIHYITHTGIKDFAPMNANFGIFYNSNKKERSQVAKESIEAIDLWWNKLHE